MTETRKPLKPGQKCLIIKVPSEYRRYFMAEVFLVKKVYGEYVNIFTETSSFEYAWHTDPELPSDDGFGLVWDDSELMPVDDPDIAQDLVKEREQTFKKHVEILKAIFEI